MANRRITYRTSGTCSQFIDVEVDDEGTLVDVSFIGGCNGNLQGIRQLVVGMKAEDVKQRLDGIRCGYKSTSCPDQLCRAIEQAQKS